ncbi:heat-inducible transcription repressor HrcA [bacterium]|nr:heat-inducible transcription repressor HrcA [bacterium]
MQGITRRQTQLLRCIVHSYIQTAVPVSSDFVVRQKGALSCSTATIRNEMADLEARGYLNQPHTSAGRIPTDKTFRLYVDSLMRREKLTHGEQECIRNVFKKQWDIHEILEQASQILGQISNELAVVLTPSVSYAIFDQLELISLNSQKVLVVIHVRSRSVKTIVIQIDSKLKEQDLKNTASVLNERLSGLPLHEIKSSIQDRCRNASNVNVKLIRLLIDSAEEIFNINEPLNVRIFGTNNILSQPEFSDKIMLELLFEVIEDRKNLSNILKQQKKSFQVVIGQEHQDSRLEPFSVVSARYRIGSDTGTIGIIGPKRMRYSKIMPLVEKMAGTISGHLS